MITLAAFPRSTEIRTTALTLLRRTSAGASELDATRFKHLIDAATPLPDDDRSIAAWQYAPWAEGTFSTEAGVYRVRLFLAGRGRLEAPDGSRGYFDIELGTWRRITSE